MGAGDAGQNPAIHGHCVSRWEQSFQRGASIIERIGEAMDAGVDLRRGDVLEPGAARRHRACSVVFFPVRVAWHLR